MCRWGKERIWEELVGKTIRIYCLKKFILIKKDLLMNICTYIKQNSITINKLNVY